MCVWLQYHGRGLDTVAVVDAEGLPISPLHGSLALSSAQWSRLELLLEERYLALPFPCAHCRLLRPPSSLAPCSPLVPTLVSCAY